MSIWEGYMSFICDSCFDDGLTTSDAFHCSVDSNFDLCHRCLRGASTHVHHPDHDLLRRDGGLAAADVLIDKESGEAALRRGAPKLSFYGTRVDEEMLNTFAAAMEGNTTLKELSFRRCGLTEEKTELLATMLQRNETLEKFDASSNALFEGVVNLAPILYTKLVVLDLSVTGLGAASVRALCDILKTNTCLKTLAMRGNRLNVESGLLLGSMLRENRTLTSLLLGANWLQDEGIKPIVDALISRSTSRSSKRFSLSKLARLSQNSRRDDGVDSSFEHLDLQANNIGENGLRHLERLFRSGFHLKRLDVAANIAEPEYFTPFFEAIAEGQGLEYLDMRRTGSLRAIYDLNDYGLEYGQEEDELSEEIRQELADMRERRKEDIEHQCTLAHAIVKALKAGQPSKTLQLKDNGFLREAAEIIGAGIVEGVPLENLQVDSMYFSFGAFEPIFRALPNSNLRTLNLLRSTHYLTRSEVEIFAECVGENTTLEFLRLGEDMPEGTGFAFAKAIKKNKTQMKSFYLKFCPFEEGEGAAFAEALSDIHNRGEQSALEALTLHECFLTPNDIESFRDLLENNESNLATLSIGGNDLRQIGIEMIAQAMEHNHKIETLVLSNTGIRDEDVPALRRMLEHNTTITHLALHNNVMSIVGGIIVWFDFQDRVSISMSKHPEFQDAAEFVRERGMSILHSLPQRILEIPDRRMRTVRLREHIERFRSHGVGTLKQAKVLVVGAGNAGKTSLCNCIMEGAWKGQPVEGGSERATIGVQTKQKTVSNPKTDEQGQIFLWDFGGQEDYFMTHSFFLSRRSVVVVVVDLDACDPDDAASFELHAGQWLRALQAQVSKPKVILVGTKADLVLAKNPSQGGIDPVAKKMDALRRQIVTMNDALRTEMDEQRVRMEAKRGATRTEEYRRIKHLNTLQFFASKQGSLGYTTSFEDRSSIEEFVSFLTEVATDPEYGIVLTVPADVEALSNAIQDVDHKAVLNKNDEARFLVPDIHEEFYEESIDLLHDVGQVVWLKNDSRLRDQIFIRPQWIVDVFASVFRHDMFENLEAREDEGEHAKRGFIHTVDPPLSEEELHKFKVDGVITREVFTRLWRASPNIHVNSMLGNEIALCISLLVSLGLVSDAVPESQAGSLERMRKEGLYLIPFYCRTPSSTAKEKEKKLKKYRRSIPRVESVEYVYEFFTYLPHGLFTRFVATINLSLDEAYQSRLAAYVPGTNLRISAYETRRGPNEKDGQDAVMESTMGQNGRGRVVLIGEVPVKRDEDEKMRRHKMLETLQSVRDHFESSILPMFPSTPYRSYIRTNYIGDSVIVPLYELQSLLIEGFKLEKLPLRKRDKPQLRETLRMYLAEQDPVTGFFILPSGAEEYDDGDDAGSRASQRSMASIPEIQLMPGARTTGGDAGKVQQARKEKKEKARKNRMSVPVELIAANATLITSDGDLYSVKISLFRALKSIDDQRVDSRFTTRLIRLLEEVERQILARLPGGMLDLDSRDTLREELETNRAEMNRMRPALHLLHEDGGDFGLQFALRNRVNLLRRLVSRIRLPFDVYFSHVWKPDAVGRDNHKRVGLLVRELRARGMNPWYDTSRSNLSDTGRVGRNMSKGIPDSEVSAVLLTSLYVRKIISEEGDNLSQREYNFIKHSRSGNNSFLAVMEPGLAVPVIIGNDFGGDSAQVLDLSENDPDSFEQDSLRGGDDDSMGDGDDDDGEDDALSKGKQWWPTVAPLPEQVDQLENAILERLFEFDGEDMEPDERRVLRKQLLQLYPSSGQNEGTRAELSLE